jgi:hypothetical protein
MMIANKKRNKKTNRRTQCKQNKTKKMKGGSGLCIKPFTPFNI